MCTRMYDITPLIDEKLQVYPGDTPPVREVLADCGRGDTFTLSTLRATVHLGAHVDAPSHLRPDGRTIEALDLDLFVGPCQVVRVDVVHKAAGSRLPT